MVQRLCCTSVFRHEMLRFVDINSKLERQASIERQLKLKCSWFNGFGAQFSVTTSWGSCDITTQNRKYKGRSNVNRTSNSSLKAHGITALLHSFLVRQVEVRDKRRLDVNRALMKLYEPHVYGILHSFLVRPRGVGRILTVVNGGFVLEFVVSCKPNSNFD